jgi:hypothetical protein
VLLTPIAAMLAFVDPGLAKNADCAALLAQAKSDAVPTKPDDGTVPPKPTDGTVSTRPTDEKTKRTEKPH